jgi:Fur family peroxide stress response transcriptional regulator
MTEPDACTEALKRRGLRVTPQRIGIMQALRRLANHPSAEDVFQAARSDFPSLSLTTVYRTLETLADHGEIEAVHVGGARARFDHRTEPHHHAACTRCGRLEDVEAPSSGVDPSHAIPMFGGERPHANAVVYFGVCTDCRGGAAA